MEPENAERWNPETTPTNKPTSFFRVPAVNLRGVVMYTNGFFEMLNPSVL